MINQKSIELTVNVKELLIEIHKLTLQLSIIEFGTERKTPEHSPVSSTQTTLIPAARKKLLKYEFFKFLVTVHAPAQHFHLETLFAAGALTNENLYTALKNKIEKLSGIINGFRQSEETFISGPAY